jgi:hypothetical protein
VIYLDGSVALAHLLAGDRFPAEDLWRQQLVSSRLLEYEVWNRIHARQLDRSHGDAVRALIGSVAAARAGATGAGACVGPVSDSNTDS